MLEDGGEELLAEARTVGVVGRLALSAPRDPVGDIFEDDGVADEKLHEVGLVGADAHGDPDQVALALQGRPAALPSDVVTPGPRLPHSAVARDGHILAVLVAPAYQLGDVLVDVLRDQGRQGQRAVVDGGPVLDLEDRVRRRCERADHARVAWAERRPLDELDVATAPPCVAFAAGHVLVGASPTASLAAVAVSADPGRLLAVGAGRKRSGLLDLVVGLGDLGDGLRRRMRDRGLGHVMEGAGEFLARLEPLRGVLGGRLPDDFHERRRDRRRRPWAVEDLRVENGRQRAGEWGFAMQQLVQDHAEGVDVGARVDRLSLHLLGRHVCRRADHASGGRKAVLVVDQLRDAEVEDLGLAAVRDQDVVRLQVAVDDLVVVCHTDC